MFGGFGGRKSKKNQPKVDPKGDPKHDAIWDGSWMALGALFCRFWAEVGGQVGAKLGRKSEKWRLQDNVEKCVAKKLVQVYASVCRPGWGVPYDITIKHSTPTPWALEHSPRAQGPVADMYIYISA